jgi:hypothetical protein
MAFVNLVALKDGPFVQQHGRILTFVNLGEPKDGAKHDLLFIKPALGVPAECHGIRSLVLFLSSKT